MALRQQRFCLARGNRLRRILGAILAAEHVYIVSTGTKVLVTDIDYHKGQREVLARIRFIDAPDKKTILKCEQFNVDVREVNAPPTPLGMAPPATHVPVYRTDINAVVNIENLSLIPYETSAAKILYKKQK